jgi:hypothetical protein
MTRSAQLLALRSEIIFDATRSSLPLEQFQNECLRPILKFQNNVIIALFKAQIQATEIPVKGTALENFVKLRMQKDTVLRNSLVGLVLALITLEELTFYFDHKSDLNKRIVAMLCQRIVVGCS